MFSSRSYEPVAHYHVEDSEDDEDLEDLTEWRPANVRGARARQPQWTAEDIGELSRALLRVAVDVVVVISISPSSSNLHVNGWKKRNRPVMPTSLAAVK